MKKRGRGEEYSPTVIKTLFVSLLVVLLFLSSNALGSQREVYDDEEFEGFEAPPSSLEAQQVIEEEDKVDDQPPSISQPQQQKPVLTDQEIQRRALAQDLRIDYIYGVVLVIYGLNFFYGRRTNGQIAAAWAKEAEEIVKDAFAHSSGVKKESQYQYKLLASGRPRVLGFQANLVLKKRHDLFSLLIGLVSSSPDLLTIEVLLQPEQVDSFVFALVKSKEEKALKKENNDLATLTRRVEVKSISSSFVVLAEADELGTAILKDVIPTINKQNAFVKYMHLTDQSTAYAQSPALMKFVFVVPPAGQMRKLTSLMNMVLYLIDHTTKPKIGRHGRSIIEGNRRKLEDQKQKVLRVQREEAAQKRKIEKKQQDQKKLESLSPEEQRKLEEKQYKKNLRKKNSKFKVVFG